MSEQWRMLVVEDDEQLNQSIVNSLRKDGYLIQGVRSGAEAIRMLWSEEFDVVIGDLKTPGADGFELLQWLRAFRPGTRMVMVANASNVSTANSASMRTQALEAGVVSYLEKPLDLHLLKEELRRLLQQTGFSANLDSFDLLDVIQIVNMSRKSIALLVNTGPEERGMLRFQNGELIWAEYGMLHGEEAFFALAAYKNGTVVHQPWNDQVAPNVTQPLSRLIFQALQYRARYGVLPQATGEQPAISAVPQVQASQLLQEAYEVDDSPFQALVEESSPVAVEMSQSEASYSETGKDGREGKEWWQQTGKRPGLPVSGDTGKTSGSGNNGNTQPFPDTIAKTPVLPPRRSGAHNGNGAHTNEKQPDSGQLSSELPTWLTEQQPPRERRTMRPSALSNTAQMPATPASKHPSPAEWQPPANSPQPITRQPTQPIVRTTDQLPDKDATGSRKAVTSSGKLRRVASPEWQSPASPVPPVASQSEPALQPVDSEPLQSLVDAKRSSGNLAVDGKEERPGQTLSLALPPSFVNAATGTGNGATPTRTSRRNYPALVAALQTLGYSIIGFIAAAVVAIDGQPVAQVAIDDLDISHLCTHFSVMLRGALQSLEQRQWGLYEHMVITSANSHILLNVIGDASDTSNARGAFLVLITTREANPDESLEVMANVEGAIAAALK